MQLAGGDRPIERHDAIELWRASIVSPHLCAGPVRFPVAKVQGHDRPEAQGPQRHSTALARRCTLLRLRPIEP
ncbi:MAG: hypothetical protein BJG00_002475 [Limnothrix sp. CACIAM 69d]|nr:MAG: hypothetical protein BJG00_002475 [Limnothrix sp. CACIAM 69d]